MNDLAPTYTGRLLRSLLGADAAVAAAGLLIDGSLGTPPLQPGEITGGGVLACLGGGLTMVTATALAGYRFFATPPRPDRPLDGP